MTSGRIRDTHHSPWLWWYGIVVAIMTAEVIAFACHYGGARLTFDSHGYIAACYRLRHGLPDLLRTPAYPLIIAAARMTFQSLWPLAVLTIQYAVFLASAWILRKAALRYVGDRKIVFAIVATYLLLPGNCLFAVSILTETFAVAGVIFLIWHMLRPLPGAPSARDAALSAAWLIFLIFLRPIFIYLLPVYLGFHLVVWWRLRGTHSMTGIRTAMVGSLLTIALVCAYQWHIKATYGVAAMSSVTTINNYHLVREAGIHSPELSRSKVLADTLATFPAGATGTESIMTHWNEVNALTRNYPIADLDDYVDKAMRSHPTEIARLLTKRALMESPCAPIFSDDGTLPHNPLRPLYPTIGMYWLFIIMFIGMMLRQWRRERQLPLIPATLTLITAGITLASVLGAMSEWDRLMFPGIPALMLICGRFASLFTRNGKEL